MRSFLLSCFVLTATRLIAEEWDVEKLAAQVRPSLVTVLNSGRDGKTQGIGTGFVISQDGLVVTNLHVVGEARPILVELQDGSRPEVKEVVAWSREKDLVIFRMSREDLPPLKLAAEAEAVGQGAKVIAMGNPMGLRYSVVDGVVSGVREVEGKSSIQVAMPIEKGNSGGPLVDAQGRVQGVINMKSVVTENLGFAIPVQQIHKLLAKQAPVAMSAWMKLGMLNPRLWKPDESGARWLQRAGRVRVEGMGDGFGGRALCFWQAEPPPLPYEVAVEVKLDDPTGAAGLAFCCEEPAVHYGFYPTAGKVRLTRFQGEDLSSWTILEDFPTPHYLEGEWNHLRVRIEAKEIVGFINGHEVMRFQDDRLRKGKAGLVKFRGTQPEFRRFQLGIDLAKAMVPSAELKTQLDQAPTKPTEAMLKDVALSQQLLEAEAKVLEQRAAQMRGLSKQVHVDAVVRDLQACFLGKADSQVDLAAAALLLAKLDNPEVDVSAYLEELDSLAARAKEGSVTDAQSLLRWIFQENGFRGSHDDFQAKSNSYLNEVIDDREGLPISLSVLVLELARRLEIPMAGLPLPGRFVVQARPLGKETEGTIYDPFDGGKALKRLDAENLTGADEMDPRWFEPATKLQIIQRMLNNLLRPQLAEESTAALPYLDALVALDEKDAGSRFSRALVRFQAGQVAGAKEDVGWLLEQDTPQSINRERLERFYQELSR
jgi:serine protease Do